jgi:hypothetical protein
MPSCSALPSGPTPRVWCSSVVVTVPIPSLTSHIAPGHAFRPDYGAVLHREQRGPVGLERTCDCLATARFCKQSLLTPKPRFLDLLPILALEASPISPRCAHAPRTGLVGLTARPAGVTIRAWLPRLRRCRRLVPGDDRSSNQPPSVLFTLEAECISTRPRRPGARIGRSVFGGCSRSLPLIGQATTCPSAPALPVAATVVEPRPSTRMGGQL